MLASTFVGSKLSGSSFLAGRQLQQQRAAAPAVPLGPLTIEAAHKKGAGSTKSECQHDSGVPQQAAEESLRRQSGCRHSMACPNSHTTPAYCKSCVVNNVLQPRSLTQASSKCAARHKPSPL
jgi:hypothetical protein